MVTVSLRPYHKGLTLGAPEEDGTLPRRLMTDLLHPNAEGYRIWYDELVPYLRKYCGK